jgi:hypothetical protein
MVARTSNDHPAGPIWEIMTDLFCDMGAASLSGTNSSACGSAALDEIEGAGAIGRLIVRGATRRAGLKGRAGTASGWREARIGRASTSDTSSLKSPIWQVTVARLSSTFSRTISRVEIEVPARAKARSIDALSRTATGIRERSTKAWRSNHSGMIATALPPTANRASAERKWRAPVRPSSPRSSPIE